MASNDVLDSPFHKAVKSARKEMLQNSAQLGEIIKMASTREETRVRYLRTKVDEQFKMTEDCLVVNRLLEKQVGSLKAQLEVARGLIPEEQLEELENALGKAKKSSAEEDDSKAKKSSETEELDRKLQSLNLDILTRFKEMEVKNLEMEAQLPVLNQQIDTTSQDRHSELVKELAFIRTNLDILAQRVAADASIEGVLSKEYYDMEGNWKTLAERRARAPAVIHENKPEALSANTVEEIKISTETTLVKRLQAQRLVVHPASSNAVIHELKGELENQSFEDLADLKSKSLSFLAVLIPEIVQRCEHLEFGYDGTATKLRCAELVEKVNEQADTISQIKMSEAETVKGLQAKIEAGDAELKKMNDLLKSHFANSVVRSNDDTSVSDTNNQGAESEGKLQCPLAYDASLREMKEFVRLNGLTVDTTMSRERKREAIYLDIVTQYNIAQM